MKFLFHQALYKEKPLLELNNKFEIFPGYTSEISVHYWISYFSVINYREI